MHLSGFRSGRAVAPFPLAIGLALATVVPAVAHGGGSSATYKAVVAPSTAAAGAALTSTITLSQLVNDDYWHNKQLGSVRITPPAGFVLTGASAVRGSTTLTAVIAGGSVTVNGINLSYAGKTAVVTIRRRFHAALPERRRGRSSPTRPRRMTAAMPRSSFATRRRASSRRPSRPAAWRSSPGANQPRPPSLRPSRARPAIRPVQPSRSSSGTATVDRPARPASRSAWRSRPERPAPSSAGRRPGMTGGTGVVSFAPTIDRFGRGYTLRASAGLGYHRCHLRVRRCRRGRGGLFRGLLGHRPGGRHDRDGERVLERRHADGVGRRRVISTATTR